MCFPAGRMMHPFVLLRTAAALEAKSEHPFAKAIMAKAEGLNVPEVSEFETLPGLGVCATLIPSARIAAISSSHPL